MNFGRRLEVALYLFPFSILFVGGLVFSQLQFHNDRAYNFDILIIVQDIIIVLTFVYCFLLKTILFIHQQVNDP